MLFRQMALRNMTPRNFLRTCCSVCRACRETHSPTPVPYSSPKSFLFTQGNNIRKSWYYLWPRRTFTEQSSVACKDVDDPHERKKTVSKTKSRVLRLINSGLACDIVRALGTCFSLDDRNTVILEYNPGMIKLPGIYTVFFVQSLLFL